jgi:hypothetical protein
MTAWRKRQIFQKINAYEGREVGVRSGKVEQLFQPAWMCIECKKIFLNKEETEIHKHKEENEN